MADVKIGMILSDNGSIKRKTDETKELNKELKASSKLAASALQPQSMAGRAAMSEAGVVGDYGRARGAAGATGAAARDFANQAQGLGGLVRLYATYAANIFAASAAFQALREAMNTTNMIQGMNQLGAASGQALGNLSKQFMDATDGAISLREAMEATIKATSSGMSSEQVLQIAEVAKKASQALGLNMTDAVNRLTRGITKLEPELLDELAIFTKIGPATENYARSVGKTASTLTDFERRQAFANAVLEEGAKKFGEIQLEANPYDKLLAQLKNVALDALTAINTVLVPVINLLASSPTALALAIAFLAKTIISQAIPAIGQWRTGLANAAKEAADIASNLASSRNEAAAFVWEKRLNIPGLQAAVETAKKELAGLQAPSTIGPATSRMLSSIQSGGTFTDKEISKVTKAIEYQEKIVSRLGTSQKEADIARATSAKNNIAYLEAERAAMLKVVAAQQALKAGYDAVAEKVDAPSSTRREKMQDLEVQQAQSKAARLSALSELSGSVATIGVVEGIKKLDEDLAANKAVTKFERIKTVGVGSMMAIGQAAASTGRYFMNFVAGPLAGLLLGYAALDLMFSKNTASVNKFNSAIDSSTTSVESAVATVEKYKNSLITLDGILASSTAFNELAASISQVVSSLQKADREASWFDRLVDGFKSVVGADLRTKFEKNLASVVEAGLDVIADPDLQAKARKQLVELFGTTDLDNEGILASLANLPEKEVISFGKKVEGVFKSIDRQAKQSSQPIIEMREGFKQLDKDYTDLVNSLNVKTPLANLGMSLIQQSKSLNNIFSDTTNSVAFLKDVLKDTAQIRMFPPETQRVIMAAASEMTFYSEQLETARKQVTAMTEQLARLQQIANPDVDTKLEIDITKGNLDEATRNLNRASEKLGSLREALVSSNARVTEMGFKLITDSLSNAVAKASVETSKTLFQGLPKTTETVKRQAQLEIQGLELQKQEITAMENLISQLELNRLTDMKIEAERILRENQGSPAIVERESAKLVNIEKQLAVLNSKNISKDLRTGVIKKDESTAALIQRKIGVEIKLTEIGAQQLSAKIKEVVDLVDASYSEGERKINLAIKEAADSRDLITSSDSFAFSTKPEQEAILENLNEQDRVLKASLEKYSAEKNLVMALTLQQEALKLGKEKDAKALQSVVDLRASEYVAIVKSQNAQDQVSKQNRDRAAAQRAIAETVRKETENIAELIRKKETLLELDRLTWENRQAVLDMELAVLDKLASKGHILDQVYADQVRQIELGRIEEEKKFVLAQSQLRTQIQLASIRERMIKAGSEGKSDEVIRLVGERDAIIEVSKANEEAIKKKYDGLYKIREMQEDLGTRLKGYDDIFRNTFSNMADAIVEFVKTGKLSFKDLVSDMISEILRLELRMQAMEMWKGIRGGTDGSGVLGWIGKALGMSMGGGSFGGTFSVPGVPVMPDFLGLPPIDLASAKGTAFDLTATNGIVEFANGGAFTNSIVSSPTLFKFAQGTGLMGEAGPEAIMPLKRDENGTLGVRANVAQTKVDVVVNNYSGAQATAQETVDSRGNRRIEVTVSEMVAGEMIRPGSSTNQALRSATGGRPYVVRR